MSASGGRQLLRLCRSVPLPTLKQGGTLNIKSSSHVKLDVKILSQWRDDGLLTLRQILPPLPYSTVDEQKNTLTHGQQKEKSVVYSDTSQEVHMDVQTNENARGNDIAQNDKKHVVDVNIDLKSNFFPNASLFESQPTTLETPLTSGTTKTTSKQQQRQQTKEGPKLIMTDDGTILPETEVDWSKYPPNEYRTVTYNDGIIHVTKSGTEQQRPLPSITLTAQVPEKVNIACHLESQGGSSIDIEGKIEGNVDLKTHHGDVKVTKLRCHIVTIDTTGDKPQQHHQQPQGGGGGGKETKSIMGGVIYATELIEARDANLTTSKRIRAKMINGSNVNIEVIDNKNNNDKNNNCCTKEDAEKEVEEHTPLDVDDTMARIDVSALYASSTGDGAYLYADVIPAKDTSTPPPYHHHNRMVRVKSSHGHVTVHAVSGGGHMGEEDSTIDEYGQRIPIVELGGVNGSCDVSVEGFIARNGKQQFSRQLRLPPASMNGDADSVDNTEDQDADANGIMAARVHVDSLSSGTISVITADAGDVGLTIDRKVEADVRLLSCPDVASLDDDLLIHEDDQKIRDVLLQHDEVINSLVEGKDEGEEKYTAEADDESVSSSLESHRRRISVQTDAFEGRGLISSDGQSLRHVEYIEGSVHNKSHEPDSRFDLRVRGSPAGGGGIGKIRLEGAAAQALHGFGGKHGDRQTNNDDGEEDTVPLPLFAIATDGRIKLETVSWFGAIARRYGMKEVSPELGRQASVGQRKPDEQ